MSQFVPAVFLVAMSGQYPDDPAGAIRQHFDSHGVKRAIANTAAEPAPIAPLVLPHPYHICMVSMSFSQRFSARLKRFRRYAPECCVGIRGLCSKVGTGI